MDFPALLLAGVSGMLFAWWYTAKQLHEAPLGHQDALGFHFQTPLGYAALGIRRAASVSSKTSTRC